MDVRERELLSTYAAENAVTPEQHAAILERAGWSEQEFREGFQCEGSPYEAAVDSSAS